MKASTATQFTKKLACPSASLLVSYGLRELAAEMDSEVKDHLEDCDFCYCEVPLLAFSTKPCKGECRTPELPMNLRILAESLLGHYRTVNVPG